MLLKNKNFYTQSIKQYGITPKGVHWKSKYTQYRRFDIITSFIKEDLLTSSIVDVGSGFGDFYLYLEKNKILPRDYIGIDCEEQMINIAKNRCKTSRFYKLNILEDSLIEADYYIASGTLNLLNLEEIEKFIKRSYNAVLKGFIFNFLKGETFNNVDKVKLISICSKYCTGENITIREGYLDNDFTIFMVK